VPGDEGERGVDLNGTEEAAIQRELDDVVVSGGGGRWGRRGHRARE
jgi:hypothetical protein